MTALHYFPGKYTVLDLKVKNIAQICVKHSAEDQNFAESVAAGQNLCQT